MKKRSARLIKKLHRHWLYAGGIEASQASYWRTRLFDSNPGDVFEISTASCAGLPGFVASAVHKYGLRYSVRVAHPVEAERWLSDNGAVIFKFWATDFPTVTSFTGNNPAVR